MSSERHAASSVNPSLPSAGRETEGAGYFEALLDKPLERSPDTLRAQDQAGAGPAPGRIDGVVIGHLAGIDASGRCWVHSADLPVHEPVMAAATAALSEQDIGREVALAFIQGNPSQPVILGLLHRSLETPPAASTAGPRPVEVQRDGERLVLTAEHEIVLRCGESSITLTKAGKVLIRGKYLLSRSDGVNRIKGGAVQIN